MEKALMRIKKGIRVEDGKQIEERGYAKRCALSLKELLKEHKEVEVTALGSLAVSNAMKTIAQATKMLDKEGLKLQLDAPVFKFEQSGDLNLAIFSITTRVE